MIISFRFDQEKSIQAMAYVVSKLGSVDKVKLMKLIYIANRSHFIRHGYPITGDPQSAMPYGPAPSFCLDLFEENEGPVFACLHLEDTTITIKDDPGKGKLADTEVEVLDEVVGEHGSKPNWGLVDETHQYPEYKAVHPGGKTSATIPWETIMRFHGGEHAFSNNRPVVSPETVAHMTCPFVGPEPDL